MEKLINYLNKLWVDTISPTIKNSWNKSKENSDRIVNAINNKKDIRDITVDNLNEISDPIVEAQNATTEAIKSIPRVEIPETDLKPLESKLEALLEALNNKEMSVKIGKTQVDTRSVVKAIEKLQASIQNMDKQEVIDYTILLDEMMKILERPKDNREIIKLQELIKKIGTSDDLSVIAEWLRVISEKEYPKLDLPIKNGRVLVEVDRAGGGGGLTGPESDALIGINTNQTDGSQKSGLVYTKQPDAEARDVTNQEPLPTDGDSVYCKDIWEAQCDMGNFSGSPCDLFDNLHSVITDTTSDNPKEILIHFNRTIPSLIVGVGAFTGNFSNLKVIGVTSGNVQITLYDESSDNTKITTRTIYTPTVGYNALKLQFHTTDTVSISNLFILKAISGVMRIQGQEPDGTFTEFQATTSGNFKTSLEEFENNISVNSNTQLKTTPFDSSGNEIILNNPIDNEPLIADALNRIYADYGATVSVKNKAKNILKFGRNPSVGTSLSTIWFTGQDQANETYVADNVNSIDRISSNNTNDTEVVTIEGHTMTGGNRTFVSQNATLNGQNKVTLTTPLNRVTRVYHAGLSATDLVGEIYVYEDTAISAGKPSDTTKIHLTIAAGKNQSEKASTSLSSTDYWIVTSFRGSVLNKVAAFADVQLEVRRVGGVFRQVEDVTSSSQAAGIFEFRPYLIIPPNADVRLRAISDSTREVSGSIQGFLAN